MLSRLSVLGMLGVIAFGICLAVDYRLAGAADARSAASNIVDSTPVQIDVYGNTYTIRPFAPRDNAFRWSYLSRFLPADIQAKSKAKLSDKQVIDRLKAEIAREQNVFNTQLGQAIERHRAQALKSTPDADDAFIGQTINDYLIVNNGKQIGEETLQTQYNVVQSLIRLSEYLKPATGRGQAEIVNQ